MHTHPDILRQEIEDMFMATMPFFSNDRGYQHLKLQKKVDQLFFCFLFW